MVTTAQLFWAFNVSEDPSQPIDTLGMTDATITRPLPFKAIFTPRIKDVQRIIESDQSS